MLSDLRFAFRQLAKSPGFTAVAVLTLALGIGVNTSMFTVINTLLFPQLSFAEPAALVRVFRTAPQSQRWPHAVANFLDLRAQTRTLCLVAGYTGSNTNFVEPGQPAERLRGLAVTGDFFSLLGVTPELGRTFLPEETKAGAALVVVLSHASWVRRFASDPGVIGRQIRIDGAQATVVGVMPDRFSAPLLWGQIELWRPLRFSAAKEQNRDDNFMHVIGRLAPGRTLVEAQAELDAIAARLEQAYPVTNSSNGLRLVPMAISGQDDSTRHMSWLVMDLAGFVLLIACANLANLQFARTAGRAREYAIRIALGAPRWRIIRELLTESLLLALLGAAGGLLLAVWGNDLLGRQIAGSLPAGITFTLDLRVFGFALGAAVLSGLALGLLPAWLASHADVHDTLKQQARGSTGDRSHHRFRQGLIVVEVALALVLLAGAGVFIRGLQRFAQRDPGWQPAGLVTGNLNLPGRYPDHAARSRFFHQLDESLARNPLFEQTTLSSSLPSFGYSSSTSFIAEGRPDPKAGQEPLANFVLVSPSYFKTVGLRLLHGRGFTADDTADKPHVVVINETMARTFWPGENPVGRRLGDPDPANRNWTEIVGVVSDAGSPGQLNPPDTRFQTYRPLMQESFGFVTVAVRGHASVEMLGKELQRTVAALDPDQPVSNLTTAEQDIERAVGNFTLMGRLLGGFAALGLSLAALGIYGVLAGFVAQRRTEIGVRLALGAQVNDVLRLVLGRGLRLVLIGTGLGLFGAFGIVALLGRIMPELGPPDLSTLAGVVVTLVGVAFLACWLPARRAARVDPMIALRAE
jgi:putative ABC transport system permease protein